MNFYKIFIVLLVASFSTGCAATMKEANERDKDVSEKGWILYSYKTKVTPANATLPYSVTIKNLQHDSIKGVSPRAALSLLPVFSLFSQVETVNSNGFVPLREGEISKILTNDLNTSWLFKEVTYDTSGKDFMIRGIFNYRINSYGHVAGLGIGYFMGLVPMLILPHSYYSVTVDTHLEIVNTGNNKIVFSKDYKKDKSWNVWMYNNNQQPSNILLDLVPDIFVEFINDIKTIPATDWI